MLREQIIGAKVNVPEIKQQVNLTAATPLDKKDTKFISSDVLLAKDTLRLLQMYDDTEENNKWKKEIQDKLTAVEDKVDVLQQYELFKVVTELPTENIDPNSIYVVPNQNTTDQDLCTEYIYRTDINNWEILGDVKVKVNVADCAKLNSVNVFAKNNQFLKDVYFIKNVTCRKNINVNNSINLSDSGIDFHNNSCLYFYGDSTDYAPIRFNNNVIKYIFASASLTDSAFIADGSLGRIGDSEDFVFTLEDGSTVTKSIRVLSTTNS